MKPASPAANPPGRSAQSWEPREIPPHDDQSDIREKMDFLGIHLSGALILKLAMSALMLAFLMSAALSVMAIEQRNRLRLELRQHLQSCTQPRHPAEHHTVHQGL